MVDSDHSPQVEIGDEYVLLLSEEDNDFVLRGANRFYLRVLDDGDLEYGRVPVHPDVFQGMLDGAVMP
jgi:hypothetical protein